MKAGLWTFELNDELEEQTVFLFSYLTPLTELIFQPQTEKNDKLFLGV